MLPKPLPQAKTNTASLVLLCAAWALSAIAAIAQSAASHPALVDFIQDGLKFHRMTPAGLDNMPVTFMVTEIATSNPAGEVMVRPDGTKMFVSLGGYDKSKIEAAYNRHASAGAQTDAGTTAAGTATNPSAAAGFDAASKTVTLTDGRSVTFIDDKHAEVRLPGPAGAQIYELEYHKGGAGGFMKSYADAASGRVGSSFGGSGVTISLASANGMPGGQIYDTARGHNTPGEVVRAKPVISAVHEASDFVKSTGQPQLAQQTVIKSLLANNLGFN